MSKGGLGNLRSKLAEAGSTGKQGKSVTPKVFEPEVISPGGRESGGAGSTGMPANTGSGSFDTKAALFGLAEKALDTVGDIASMVESFQKTKQAKEVTKQVELQSKATIRAEIEQTKRRKLELKTELKIEREKAKVELERIGQELAAIQAELKKEEHAHAFLMRSLDKLEASMAHVQKLAEAQIAYAQEVYSRGELPTKEALDQIDHSTQRLIEFSQEMTKLRVAL